MKVRKAKKNLRKGKKLEPTKPLTVVHTDLSVTKKMDVASSN